MPTELLARGQATIYTQTDGYTVHLSRQNCVVSTDKDGRIATAVTVTTVVSARKGSVAATPVIGTLPTVAGCSLSKSGTTVSLVFAAGTSLADSGLIDIPVTVDGNSFTLAFAYAKARQGTAGASGVDANLLEWVADWNTAKTVIGSNSVITPKIFAGVKNSNGTLTGIALGRFPLTTVDASGSPLTETIDGIYGFKDGYRTFCVDSGGNTQLGRGNQYIKFNATTGKVEFGSEVSLNWIGATYIDASGIFTGRLLADTVEALNLNVTKGTIGGWTIAASQISKNSVVLSSDGSITNATKWKLNSDGSGQIAGGNIGWDASGNVTFASSVSLNWTTPINSITTALGGSSFPKLTKIDATGIYTGTLTASQVNAVNIDAASIQTGTLSADRIASGSITSAHLNAASIRANIINTAYINSLYCAFDRGTIGSWYIEKDCISSDYIRLGRLLEVYPNYVSGFGIQMISPYSGEECFALGITDWGDPYNCIAGWMFDEYYIWKNNVTLSDDGSLINHKKWHLNNDGSGVLACGNISWNAQGRVSFSSSVSLNWTTPINSITTALGGSSFPKLTKIDATGIYTGTLTASQVNAVNIDAASIQTGVLSAGRIAAGSITAEKLDAASIQSSIINTDYINGLSCTFAKGTIGGWTIASDTVYHNNSGKYLILRSNETGGSGAPSSYGRRGLTVYLEDAAISAGAVKIVQMGMLTNSGSPQTYPSTPNYGFRILLQGNKEVFRADSSGAMIAGWKIDGDSIFRGTKANVSGAYTGASGYITIGSNGIRGNMWRLEATGAGGLAGGNIVWDASGNVTFASSVSLNWTTPIDGITTALGGSSFPKLTKIDATGIYTGTVSAGQINVDSTLIVGGSTYNGSLSVRDASNNVKVTLNRNGITAVGGTIGGWTIAASQISKNSVILSSDGSITNGTKWKLNNDGSGQFAGGNISWTASGTVTVSGTINASSGAIGGFEIGSGRIGSTASGSGSGGGLAIYNDLFRVGSSTSYVLLGDDTFPASAGGAFTSTGRITNSKSNSGYTNCGIYISVSGATKNFGLYSNAALLAPAVIGNKVKTIAFSGSGYSLDFSQYNVFFIYGTSSYSVNLPAESQVASMFGLSSLPSDFGFVFTLVYNYNYGNQLTINGIKNNNGGTVNCAMSCGDSMTILCAKFPSFHYQVISHYY
jgi:hypothetical protein